MKSLLRSLQKELKGAGKIAIIGVGNKDSGDDDAGVRCAEMLAEKFEDNKKVKIITAGEAPEAFTGEIRRFGPTHTIIIDACVQNRKPGSVYLVDRDKIDDGDISTHHMPLSMLASYIEKEIGCKITIIGIEPEVMAQGETLSPSVEKAAFELAQIFHKTLAP